jgi:hypothetical protein
MAAVGQHLHGKLPDQPAQRLAKQFLVGEEDRQPGQCLQVLDQMLEVLDQMIAAGIRFQVPPQETGVGGQAGDETVLGAAARHQDPVNSAERPGALPGPRRLHRRRRADPGRGPGAWAGTGRGDPADAPLAGGRTLTRRPDSC